MSNTGIPIPGTPAYWAAQREAVALVNAWQHIELGADGELDLLRRIAAHGFASRMMAAHGANVARWVAILETLRVVFEDDVDEDGEGGGEGADPDGPPHGQDWCRRGCQILYGMKCGMCGYEGRGVRIDQVDTIAEHCCHCNARTYQSPDGICELCGKDAETPDVPAPPPPASCFWDCGPVNQGTQCCLCRDLERHAQGASVDPGHSGRATLPAHPALPAENTDTPASATMPTRVALLSGLACSKPAPRSGQSSMGRTTAMMAPAAADAIVNTLQEKRP